MILASSCLQEIFNEVIILLRKKYDEKELSSPIYKIEPQYLINASTIAGCWNTFAKSHGYKSRLVAIENIEKMTDGEY